MNMDDLTGMGKIAEATAKLADSKLATAVYSDALSSAAKDTGRTLTDISKPFRLFLAPFQLAAVAQARFEQWLDSVRCSVPAERQIEVAPSIAGPVLQSLIFLEHGNPLIDLYL